MTATITVDADAEVGDTLSYTVDGGTAVEVVLTAEDLESGLAIEVIPEAEIVAQVIDAANNASPSTTAIVAGILDETAPSAPSISVESAGEDNLYSEAEVAAGAAGTVTATITVDADAEVGDTLSYTVDGGTAVEVVLTAEDLASGVAVEVTPEAEIVAQVIDAANNASPSTTAIVAGILDETAPSAPSISVESAGEDNLYSEAEVAAGAADTVTATITVDADAEVGDTLSYTVDGGTAVEVVLTAEDLESGVAVEVTPGAEIVARVIDGANNASPSTTANVAGILDETAPSAPTITFASTGDDAIYNASEVDANGNIVATITVAEDAVVGDSVSYTVNGGDAIVVTLTDDNIGGITVDVKPEAEIVAQVIDAANNASAQTSNTAPGADVSATDLPSISFDTGNDDVYNADELDANGNVVATITVPNDAVIGDSVSYTVNGGDAIEVELTADNIGGVEALVKPDDVIVAQVIDAAGNPSDTVTETVPSFATVVNSPELNLDIISDSNNANFPGYDLVGEDGVTVTYYNSSDQNQYNNLRTTVNADNIATVVVGDITGAYTNTISGAGEYTFILDSASSSTHLTFNNDGGEVVTTVVLTKDPSGNATFTFRGSDNDLLVLSGTSDDYTGSAILNQANNGGTYEGNISDTINVSALENIAFAGDAVTLNVTSENIPENEMVTLTFKDNDGQLVEVLDGNGDLTSTVEAVLNNGSYSTSVTPVNGTDLASLSATASVTLDDGSFVETVVSVGDVPIDATLDASDVFGDAYLTGGDGNDSLYGSDSGNDELEGGDGNDSFYVSSDSFSSIDGGNGSDTLYISNESDSIDLNFTDGSLGSVTNIEVLALGEGDAGNTVTLTGSAVEALTDENDTLYITGDEQDSVVTDMQSTGESFTDAGVTYNEYSIATGGTLFIDEDVTVTPTP